MRVVSTRNYFLNKICVKNQFVLKEFYKKILWSRTSAVNNTVNFDIYDDLQSR